MQEKQLKNGHVDLNYFICTLGQAAANNAEPSQPFKTVSDFIDYQALKFPTCPAVGFPITRKNADDEWDHVIYSERLSVFVQKATAAPVYNGSYCT